MLISNFNLCKSEWLELVFAKRNKEYGAYYLRQHYAQNLVKAMCITFFSIISTAVIFGFIVRVKPGITLTTRVVELTAIQPVVIPPKEEPKKAKPLPSKPAPPVKTVQFVTPVPTDKPEVVEPPKINELTEAIGPETTKAPGSGTAANVTPAGTGGNEVAPEPVDNAVHNYVEIMPEPYGGAAGWTKFLQKNLKYPPEALDRNMSGKVLVSFIVEKDGHLSNIMVDRGAGFGMDEEAARVLKLAHPWTPGVQNGKPVRVKYTLPINFSIGD